MLGTARRTAFQRAQATGGHRGLATAAPTARSSRAPLVLATAATLVIGTVYLNQKPLRADSGYESQSQLHKGQLGSIRPSVFMWGRNSHNVVAPSSPESDLVKKAKVVAVFDGAVLRDLVLHEKYGPVDAKGDVLQWGLGFDPTSPGASSDPAAPHPTLRNRDVVSVAASEFKVYALTRSGEVMVFPAERERQLIGERSRASGDAWWRLGWLVGSGNPGTDVEKLKTDAKLARGEKFTSISCGTDHVLAVTSKGRAFATPINLAANKYGQLGVRHIALLSLHASALSSGEQHVSLIPDLLLNDRTVLPPPPKRLDPLLLPHGASPPQLAPQLELDPVVAPRPVPVRDIRLHEDEAQHTALENDIRFATTLHEIPALKDIPIAELVAGSRHSVARTTDGKVLGFGANDYGQLGLGPSLSYPSIATPTEVPLSRCYPKATRVICERIAAGGSITYFVVEREEIPSGRKCIDLLATGNGQFGGMGNGSWAHSASPVKVKTVSGLLEWSDAAQKIAPIPIRTISAGRTHVAIVLDNAVDQGQVKFGRDVFVLGQNEFYQLGTGKRSNLSTPQHLPPLPYTGLSPAATVPGTDEPLSSGTLSPMPHSRLQLAPEIKVNGKRVEETIVAGDSATAVYWRIIDP